MMITPTTTTMRKHSHLFIMFCLLVGAAQAAFELHNAASSGFVDQVKSLIDKEADVKSFVNQLDTNGRTPLRIAAEKGHYEVVKTLIKSRADLDLCGDNRATPLCAAAYMGHAKVVELLIEKGADVNLSARFDPDPQSLNYTPLGIAMKRESETHDRANYSKVVNALKKAGATDTRVRAKPVDVTRGDHTTKYGWRRLGWYESW